MEFHIITENNSAINTSEGNCLVNFHHVTSTPNS